MRKLTALKRTATAGPTAPHLYARDMAPWVVLRANLAGFRALGFNKLGAQLSRALGCTVWSISNYDGDFLESHLFVGGDHVDSVSVIDKALEQWYADRTMLPKLSGDPVKAKLVRSLLDGRPANAEQTLHDLVYLLGLTDSWDDEADLATGHLAGWSCYGF
ncbi:MAG: hypothetical protein H3C34_10955 [Caldilineaceae bacterium]|nr:hypothetical protein [Caldilineaceae bacterium]